MTWSSLSKVMGGNSVANMIYSHLVWHTNLRLDSTACSENSLSEDSFTSSLSGGSKVLGRFKPNSSISRVSKKIFSFRSDQSYYYLDPEAEQSHSYVASQLSPISPDFGGASSPVWWILGIIFSLSDPSRPKMTYVCIVYTSGHRCIHGCNDSTGQSPVSEISKRSPIPLLNLFLTWRRDSIWWRIFVSTIQN
jgi:hypothetical protein